MTSKSALVGLLAGCCWAAFPLAARAADPVPSASATSSEVMIRDVKAALSFVQDGVRKAEKIQAQAEKENDKELVDCITPPYSSLRTLESVASARFDLMMTHLDAGRVNLAEGVHRSFSVVQAKAATFVSQVDACTAEGKPQDGSSSVNANTDALTDSDDTAPLLGNVDPDVDTPTWSPFQ